MPEKRKVDVCGTGISYVVHGGASHSLIEGFAAYNITGMMPVTLFKATRTSLLLFSKR